MFVLVVFMGYVCKRKITMTERLNNSQSDNDLPKRL